MSAVIHPPATARPLCRPSHCERFAVRPYPVQYVVACVGDPTVEVRRCPRYGECFAEQGRAQPRPASRTWP
jgi:hypothetical protein